MLQSLWCLAVVHVVEHGVRIALDLRVPTQLEAVYGALVELQGPGRLILDINRELDEENRCVTLHVTFQHG